MLTIVRHKHGRMPHFSWLETPVTVTAHTTKRAIYFRRQLERQEWPYREGQKRAQGCVLVPRPLHLSQRGFYARNVDPQGGETAAGAAQNEAQSPQECVWTF